MRHHVGWLAGLAATSSLSANAAPFYAPLPEGYHTKGAKLVSGMYAEVTGLTSIFDDQEIEQLDAACHADGKSITWQDRNKGSEAAVRIYRTAEAVAEIRDTARLVTDRKTCAARYIIERNKTVKMGAFNYTELLYFTNPDINCSRYSFFHRCSTETISGLRVTCLNRGDGLVGNVICLSRKNDLTRGLLVSYSSYVDDGSMPTGSWHLSMIEPNALIDPVVFSSGPNGE